MNPAGAASAGAASNQYQILGHLATGGMAELFLARAVGIAGFERYVVLKRIMAEHSRNHRFVTMFLDEARLAAQLHHPNIAQVYDIGRVSDAYFFTLEYVHGENCRDVLQRVAALKRKIPVEQTLTIIAGAVAGLHYAHDKRGIDRQPLGIVHRDVSPSNLMVSYEGAVKVVDFGIAKAAHRVTETRSGAIKGKVAYMSPEQCTGQPVDRRSDIFSLGIVFYEMATMTRLFKYGTDFETMTHIVNGDVPAPTSRRPELSRELEAIILRCLARRPEDRFQSGAELLEAIETLAARERLSLSAMALGRYVRELFGERPEPWYELEAAGEHTGLVTIETTSAGLEAMADPLATAPRPWAAGGREWLPGPAASVVSAVSVLAPPPASAAPAASAPAASAPIATAALPWGAAPVSPPVVAPPTAGPPAARLIPAPPVLPRRAVPRATDPHAAVAPPSTEAPPRARPPTSPAVRLPLPPPELADGDPGAVTVVGPATGPLLLAPPEVERETPDREPSWGGEPDPSWRGGSDVDLVDLRPRRRWILWSALATAAVGILVIALLSSGGEGSPSAPAAAGAPADEASTAPVAAPEPSSAAAPAPSSAAVAAPAAAPLGEPAAVAPATDPASPARDPAAPAVPSPSPSPSPGVEAPPAPSVVAGAPSSSAPRPTATRPAPARPRPTAATARAPRPAVTTTPAPAPRAKAEPRPEPRPARKPPVKCGGLYPPCD